MTRRIRLLPTGLLSAGLCLSALNCGDSPGQPRIPADIVLSDAAATLRATSDGADPVAIVIQITNAGDEPLTELSARITYAAGEPTGWLTARLSSTTAPSILTLAGTTGALRGGLYHGTVTLESPAAAHGPVALSVVFEVAAAAPAPPSNLVAVAPSDARIELTWTDNSRVEDGFRIERCTGADCTDFSYVAGLDADVTTFSHVGNSSPNVTYRYRVQAVNAVALSPFSNVAGVTTPRLPAIAVDRAELTFRGAEGGPSPAAQTVTITNDGDQTLDGLALGAVVYFEGEPQGWLGAELDRTNAPATLTVHAASGDLPTGSYHANVPVQSAAAANSPQYVTVTLHVGRPDLAITAPEVLTVTPSEVQVPGSVVLGPLTVTNRGDADAPAFWIQFLLSADAALTSADRGLLLYSGVPLAAGASMEINPVSLVIPSGVADGDYFIGALLDVENTVLESDEDNNAKTTGLAVGQAPAIALEPRELTFAATAGGADPAWQDVAITNAGGRTLNGLQVSVEGGGGWLAYGLEGTTAPTQLDIGAQTGTLPPGRYTATVRVSSPVAANSPQAVQVIFDVAVPQGDPPAAPANLRVTRAFSNAVTIEWADNSTSEDGFRIEWCQGEACSAFVELSRESANVTLYSIGLITPLTSYSFRVRAYGAGGNSEYSNIASVVTPAADAAPAPASELVATPVSTSAIDLSWTDNSLNEYDFHIERCTGTDCGDFARVGSVTTNVTAFRDAGLAAGTTYRYRVLASNGAGSPGYSNVVAVATLQPPMIGLDQAAVSLSSLEGRGGAATVQVAVTNDGSGTLSGLVVEQIAYGAEPRAADWLTATLAGSTAPTTLHIDAAPQALAVGSYSATIYVGSPEAANSPQPVVVTFAVLPRSDLQFVPPLAVNPTSVTAGGLISLGTVQLRNAGAGTSSPFVVGFYLSLDSTITTADTPLDDAGLPQAALAPGAEIGIGGNWQIPATTPAGTYFVGILADTEDQAFETNEANNFISVRLPVTVPASAPAIALAPTTLAFTAVSGGANPAEQTIAITNGGEGTLSGLDVAIEYPPGGATGWLQYGLDQHWAPVSLRVSATTGTLVPGIHLATIVVSAAIAGNSPQTIPVTFIVTSVADLVVSGGGETSPSPFAVTPASVSQGGVVNLSAFTIYNGGQTAAGTFDVGFYLSSDSAITSTDLRLDGDVVGGLAAGAAISVSAGYPLLIPPSTPAGSYYVGVLADGPDAVVESDETNNYVSAPLTVTTLPPPPAAPSNLTAATLSSSAIRLAWTDNATSEDGFYVERCTPGSFGLGCFSLSGDDLFTRIATLGANVTTYTAGGSAGTTYRFRVRAFNARGVSAASNEVTAATQAAGTPNAPSGLVVTGTSPSQTALSWTDNSGTETGFRIERCAGAECTSYASIATLAANTVAFADAGLGEATLYRYRIQAYNTSGGSAYSAAEGSTLAAAAAPAAPSALVATVISGNQINLSWIDNATNETGFRLERCAGSGCTAYAEIATLGANATSYNNTGLAGSTVYRYRVRAYNSVGASAYTTVAQGTTPAVPPTPSGLVATAISSGQINLTWVDNSTNESGFRIERCEIFSGTSCTNFAQVVELAANVTSYANVGLRASDTYMYRVYAFNANGVSPYSTTATATTLPLEAPSGLTAAVLSSGRIQLNWTDNTASAIHGFDILRCAGAGCTNFAEIGSVSASTTTYLNTGLAASTSYSYRVRAYLGASTSAVSNTATAVTLAAPAAPTSLAAAAVSATQINLSWTDRSTGETQFRIERCAGEACTNFTQIATVGANVTTYNNTSGLVGAASYRYRVRAYDGDNSSAYSNEALATTLPAVGSPAAPSGLVAVAAATSRIDLTWVDNASNETGYVVERCSGAGCTNFTVLISAAGSGVTSYASTGLSAGTSYSHRVRYFNTSGNSLYSNVATATTPAAAASTAGGQAQR